LAVKSTSSIGALFLFDAMSLEWQRVRLTRNPECPTCSCGG